MPIYTYACNACGAELERRQSFSDAPLTTCEACGGALRRVLHPVGVIFKGSGFYNTDYKKGSGNGSASTTDGAGDKGKESAASTESKSTDSGKTDGTASSTTTKSDSSKKTAAAGAKE